jgi:hypothetical protein
LVRESVGQILIGHITRRINWRVENGNWKERIGITIRYPRRKRIGRRLERADFEGQSEIIGRD